MHLGFQEYLAAREIQREFLAGYGKSDVLRHLAEKFGQGWWQEVTLLLVALADHCLFEPFMREVVQRAPFTQHSGLVEMCLDDAAERSTEPFLELLDQDATINPDKLWERQLHALRIIERIDAAALEPFMVRFKAHPYDKIRQWIRERLKEAVQRVIRPEPSGYELVWIPGRAFMMGSDEHDREQPIHEVHVPDFYMGRYAVSNEEYGRYLEATGYEEPDHWGDREFNQPRQPVVGVAGRTPKRMPDGQGCNSLRKRSGNTPAGPVQKHATIPAIRKKIWIGPGGIAKTQQVNYTRWVKRNPMHSGCMTCTVMSMSGSRMIIMTVTKRPRMMAARGLIIQGARPVSCAAARGTTVPGTAGRPSAAGAGPASGAAISGSGLSVFQVSKGEPSQSSKATE